ncbi:NADP-dependent oxidoreductase [Chitinophaga sp. OAE865]|uniref:NADP-dependent oxidoreductase n=1 Tax=Chitinophaga sp. OAE865 TaxID=2817898 RepID=UPI001AE20C0A
MKAFIIDRYGRKEKLHMQEIAEPVIKENDVLIRIYSASVNLLDSKIKNGEFKLILPYKTPLVLGHDVAGVIIKTGANVSRFKAGDEVYARPADHRIGTFAELIAVDEADIALKPKKLTMEEAASIPLVALTAWQALVEKADLKKGQKVFIQAGSGGVGTIAIQLAKYIGATVATTTGTTNVAWVKALGADIVIDYKKEDFEAILHDYDVVLNSQDTSTLEKSLRVLKPGGKLISISGPPDTGFAKEIGLGWPLKMLMALLSLGIRRKAKRRGVDYSFLFMRAEGSQLSRITALIDAGIINPVVDKVFPFAKTEEALTYVESGRAKGKVVINIR